MLLHDLKREEIILCYWPRAWQTTLRTVPVAANTPAAAQRFDSAPLDQVFDPRYAVPVSRGGEDRGALRRDTYRDTVEDARGDEVEAFRIKTGLAAMWKSGGISEEMFLVGVKFQTHFGIAHIPEVKTTDLSGLPGGGPSGHAGYIERRTASIKIVNEFLNLLGYPGTAQALAAYWVIGHGYSFRAMAAEQRFQIYRKAGSKDFWSAMTVSALEQMTLHVTQKNIHREKSPELRGWTAYDPGMLSVSGNYVVVYV